MCIIRFLYLPERKMKRWFEILLFLLHCFQVFAGIYINIYTHSDNKEKHTNHHMRGLVILNVFLLHHFRGFLQRLASSSCPRGFCCCLRVSS